MGFSNGNEQFIKRTGGEQGQPPERRRPREKRVHQLAPDLGDAVLVQAANCELDAEPGIDPGWVDHQVPMP